MHFSPQGGVRRDDADLREARNACSMVTIQGWSAGAKTGPIGRSKTRKSNPRGKANARAASRGVRRV